MRRLLAFAALALVLGQPSLRAGCLAPADAVIDSGVPTGPFASNADSILYARPAGTGTSDLVLRPASGFAETVATHGEASGFSLGALSEQWDTFHSGSLNAEGDLGFVASTRLEDDAGTPQDESSATHRGAYVRRGGTIHEVARFGKPSPILDIVTGPVAWGAFFDIAVADRDAGGAVGAVLTGQLAGTNDHRSGLFGWKSSTPSTVTPLLLSGDPSPAGGNFIAFGRLRGNGAGDVAFFAVTTLTTSSPQVPGLYVRRADGSILRVLKVGSSGDAAPGGGTLSVLGDFDLDDAGVVTFAAAVSGGTAKTGLFRARAPSYLPEEVVLEGDATPLGGTYASFSSAAIRAAPQGSSVFAVPLSDDLGGEGIFNLAADGSAVAPLVTTDDAYSVAALGADLVAYETATQVHLVANSDGSEQGPTDFRIVRLDVRNAVPLHADSIVFQGSFVLPPWDVAPPATFRQDVTRFTPTAALSGTGLTKIAEVKVVVSANPGNNFVLSLGGTDASPTGTYRFNGQLQELSSVRVSSDGTAATWKFHGNPGPGSLTVDLARGTFKLTVAKATIQPSYDAFNFRVALVLRSADDVAQSRTEDQSFFVRDLRIRGEQPGFGAGRRVTSTGAGTPGGTLFVDALRVTRRAAAKGKPATDAIKLAGTLRLCPGTAAVRTPTLTATLHLGSFALEGVELTRVGRTSAYRYRAAGTELRVDFAKSTFSLVGRSAPLAELASPVSGSATNGPSLTVGGMALPFSISIPRVYEAAYDVPVVRLRGGKVFSR